MRKTKKRSRGKAKYLVLASIMILTIIIIAVVVATNNPTQKKKARDYFDIVAVGALGWNYTSTSIVVKSLFLSVTPVGGDAHEIFIDYEGAPETIENMPYKTLVSKSEIWSVEIQFSKYSAHVNATGYVEFVDIITIGSQETTPDPWTLYLPLNDVTILPGPPP